MDVDTAAAKLIERLESWMNSLEGIASQHAAAAWETALRVHVISGWGRLLDGALLLAFAAAGGFLTRYLFRRAGDAHEYDKDNFAIPAFFVGVAAVFSFGFGVGLIADPWAWVSITDPATALARDLLR